MPLFYGLSGPFGMKPVIFLDPRERKYVLNAELTEEKGRE